MNPLDLQGLAGGKGSTLQRLVLPDLDLEHRLHRAGSLGGPKDLRLRLCTAENGMKSSEKKDNLSWGRKPTELTLGLLLPATGLGLTGLGLFLQPLGLEPRGLGYPGSFTSQLCIIQGS